MDRQARPSEHVEGRENGRHRNSPASLSPFGRSRSTGPVERLVPAVCGGDQPGRAARPVPAAAGGGNDEFRGGCIPSSGTSCSQLDSERNVE